MLAFCAPTIPCIEIGFEAVKGSGYQSDIAVDDVVITSGKCSDQGTSLNTLKYNLFNDSTLQHAAVVMATSMYTSVKGNHYIILVSMLFWCRQL